MKSPWNTIQDIYGYSDLEIRRIKYALSVIGSELSKMLIMFFLFFFIGKAEEYVVSLLVLCSLRAFSGGAHMKHYWTCFLCSLCVLTLSSCILPQIPLTAVELSILAGICVIITYCIGPIPSKMRPTISYENWKKFRLKATIILFIYFGISIIFPKYHYLGVVVWTIIVQTIQLIITNILQKGERYEKIIEQPLR